MGREETNTHNIDALRKTRHPQIRMFPHQHVQPSRKAKHIGHVVQLLEAVIGSSFLVVPHVPLRLVMTARPYEI